MRTRVCCARRVSGKVWLVKLNNKIVHEIRCDQDANAQTNAHRFALQLRQKEDS